MNLQRALSSNKTLCTVGFDDQPFERGSGRPVGLAGVACKGTRCVGMVWGQVAADGWDGTETVAGLLEGGKFLDQLHAVLLDGITFGGFNVVDLEGLSERLDRPCIAVMRHRPDFEAVEAALQHVPDSEERFDLMRRAGDIHAAAESYFQVRGASPEAARAVVDRLTVEGHIPEPIRMAHLIASAVGDGESGRRA